ncbi:hypothetical protein GEV33_011277 [Tenebrio molitor]|uniref:Reverse transcriptase domain-containing protein n=1 Tax=Tenebrio molitor TaxID=7067 RepID=A0A8J6HB32_TENMO|nr:hypothetical protein GEV33_011277 [Tenebrio molitor]
MYSLSTKVEYTTDITLGRINTPDFGIEYKVLIPAYFALKLNKENIEDFEIQSNVEDLEHIEDVVIEVTTNETQISFAIQLKHTEDKDKWLLPSALEAEQGDFSLKKYCEAFKCLSDVNKQRQFILYTNAKFDPKRTAEMTNFTMIQDDCCISEDNGLLMISIEDNQIHYLNRPVNILCADAGMGKTTMLKKLRNECDSRFWTIAVDLKVHNEFFKTKHDVNERFNHLIEGNENSFSKHIKAVFRSKKNIYFFFDGLDEVERSCVYNVLDSVKELSSEGFHVWISSRKNLTTKLEDRFDKIVMDMEDVEEEQQKFYIKNRLKREYNHEQIENLISKIFNSSDIDNNCQVLGKFLQLYIITQNFLDNKDLHQRMTENTFVFTKMYELFFRGRFKHNLDKEEPKNSHLFLANVEDVLELYELVAVHSVFGEEILKKLILDQRRVRRFLNQIKTNKDPLCIITKVNDEGKVVFEHFTYGEYFAARFFANNFDKARLIREELFSDERKNLMMILNVLLAEENPLHLALIYRDVDQIAKYIEDKNVYDKAGRNPLHLATYINPRCVDRNDCFIEVSIEALQQDSGVPQRSVLGPLFFNIYVNDIVESLNLPCLLFADDMKVYSMIGCHDDALRLQDGIDKIVRWCADNNLFLNCAKCKDLGVVFDSKLSFTNHIESIDNSSFKSFGFVLRNGREFSDVDTLKLLYFTYVRSRLEYASIVWSPMYSIHIFSLERVQCRFLKNGVHMLTEGSLTFQNGPDFRYRSRRNCERRGKRYKRWNRRHLRGSRVTVHGSRPIPCVCVFVLKGGRLGGVFSLQQVLANPWRKTETAGRIVQRELQPYDAADLGFFHEGQPPYASADHISPPCWAAVITQDPSREQDLTPDSPRPRIPKSRNRRVEGRKDPEDLPWIRTA